MTAPRIDARRPKTGRAIPLALFSIALLATACDMGMGMTDPSLGIPDGINWGSFDGFTAGVYGHVLLADSTPAGAGYSVVATVYKTGCDGKNFGPWGPSITGEDGRYGTWPTVSKSDLPPGDTASRVLCTRLSAHGPLPGDTASVVISDLVFRSGFQFDSVNVDLRLRSR